MDIAEIIEKEESLQRTEKALDDEYMKHIQKVRNFRHESEKFYNTVRAEGYHYTSRGWEKQ